MKNTYTIATLLVALFLTSCNSSPSDKSSDDKEKELLKKELELTKKELELKIKESQQTTQKKDATAPTDIHDDPLKVVQAIFDAAISKDLSQLSGLCDPTGSGDSDTKSICKVIMQPQQAQEEFIKYFRNGKTVGDAILSENSAKVKIKFGPDGAKDEEMNLVKVDGKWYLSSF